MNDYNEYKIAQLRNMLTAETSEDAGGYGAHLDHWSGRAKPINLDADALRVLISYYESCQPGSMTKSFTLHTYDLQDIVIALINLKVEKTTAAEETDDATKKARCLAIAARASRMIDIFAGVNLMTGESNNYSISFTARN